MSSASHNPLPFPQDYFRRLLEEAFDTAPFLNYGLYGDPREPDYASSVASQTISLHQAQQELAEYFRQAAIARISSHSDKLLQILVSGPTLGGLATFLATPPDLTSNIAGQGPQENINDRLAVHWLMGRNAQQTKAGSHPLVTSYAADLLEFDGRIDAPKAFDVIILEGSTRYLDHLALLQKSHQILASDGCLMIAGEFLRDDSRIERSELANLTSFRQLAQRLGFQIIEELDATVGAQKSLQAFTQIQRQYGERINEFAADVQVMEINRLNKIAAEFSSQRRSFRVFQLGFSDQPLGEYPGAEYGDVSQLSGSEIRQVFEKSFNVEFDLALWRWKYLLGNGKCVFARVKQDSGKPTSSEDQSELAEDTIVAHYGGAPRHIEYFGKPSMAIQVCDVMVLPGKRQHYGKRSLFFKVATTFLEREIGNTVGHLLGFGFPNQKAMNIALRLGLYDKTDDFVEVVYSESRMPDQNQAYGGWSLTLVNVDDEVQRQTINQLWEEMKADHKEGIVGVRDSSYVDYRYFKHPLNPNGDRGDEKYRVALLHGHEHQSLIVLRWHEQSWLLMDLICAESEIVKGLTGLQALLVQNRLSESLELDPSHPALRQQATGIQLKLWITKGKLDLVQTNSSQVNELGIEIPCNSWNPGPSPEVLYGKWWLTAGDMDFL